MRVIKLGGSLLTNGQFFDCLKHILKTNQQTVIVCGGGEFAEQVRTAQKKWLFDDNAAHKMAILAMQQTAILSQNLYPEFEILFNTSNFKNQKFSIWYPDLDELKALKSSWDITSDSLAAWLANELNAEKLIIVKSCEIDDNSNLSQLKKQLIVDVEFENFLKNVNFDVTVCSVNVFLGTFQ